MRQHRTLRKLAAWCCLFAWLLLVLGPVHHSIGHRNDHVHIGGATVQVPGAAAHDHGSERPSDLIEQARRAWAQHEQPDGPPPDPEREEPTHGFDTLAHFAGTPLPPTLTSLPPPASVDASLQLTPYAHPALIDRRDTTVSIRGPPSVSV